MGFSGKFYFQNKTRSVEEMAELSLVGSCLVNPLLWGYAGNVSAQDMATQNGRLAIESLIAEEGYINPVALAYALERGGITDPFYYVGLCLEAAGSEPWDIRSYVKILRETAVRRRTAGL